MYNQVKDATALDLVFYVSPFVLINFLDNVKKIRLPPSLSQAALGRVKSKLYEELV